MKVPFAFHSNLGTSSRTDGPDAPVPASPRSRWPHRRRQSGVALVVTLILLAIITTLAIAFIALTQRETATVAAVSATTDAELAAEAGFQRAKGEILARILTANRAPVPNEIDPFGPGFMVSVAWDTNRLQTATVAQPDLYRDPSPPVYILTNLNRNLTLDDRHYLDLNQNQYFDETGLVPITTDARPRPTARFSRLVPASSNWVVGDPQWIGVLSYPTAKHSPENRFISRFAWTVLPAGQTLDINAIHNQALGDDFGLNMGDAAGGDGYNRFQGAGAWELNLAGFLADLNQPIWGRDYQFFPNAVPPQARAIGSAFADAREILRYRYTPRYLNNGAPIVDLLNPPVRSEQLLDSGSAYFAVGAPPATVDGLLGFNGIDEFSDAGFVAAPFDSTRPWPGARNKRNFYTPHDLLNHAKVQHRNAASGFIPRLQFATFAGNSYDRYTFGRLLSQLGTDSAPENDDDKINVNYVNVRSWANPSVRAKVSDLLTWSDSSINFTNRMGRKGPELFFLSTVRRLLLEERSPLYTNFVPVLSWRDYDLPGWPTNAPVLDTGHPLLIPVGTNGVAWGYSGRVHQILQLAANIYDALRGPEGTENAGAHAGMFPTIFRPRIELVNGIPHIVDYRVVDPADPADPYRLPANITTAAWTDLLAGQIGSGDYLAYNVPLILGARKGFPNFNEFASRTSVSAVRRLEARKNQGQVDFPSLRLTETFTLYLTNDFGIEAWNSYYSNTYPRPLQMIMTNIATVTISRSNSAPLPGILPIRYGRVATIPANGWKRSKASTDDGFIATNFPSVLVTAITNVQAVSKTGPDHPWRVTVRNQLRFFLVDTVANRLVDAVAISVTNDFFDVGQRLTENWTGARSASSIWLNGSVGDARLNWRRGINDQLLISAGRITLGPGEWEDYGPQSQNKTIGIQRFNAFLNDPEQTYTVIPFVPSRVITQTNSWRVNDPLVHYTAEDLYRGSGYDNTFNRAVPAITVGSRNSESQPWPGVDAAANNMLDKSPAIKDPGVRSSDYWEFPTNKVPSIGLLGRVHRGTPWQTVYFKADASTTNAFASQSGIPIAFRGDAWNNHVNPRRAGGVLASMQPTNDWRLLDIFSTAVHPNATRGRLSINQTNLAAWSAVLSGTQLRATARTNAGVTRYGSGDFIITPAALADPGDLRTWQVEAVASGVMTNRFRRGRVYTRFSDILSVPQFSYLSPVLTNTTFDPYSPPPHDYLYDSDYESLPEKVLGLLKLGEPRFVIYAWGQSLKPAEYGLTAPDADGNVKPTGPALVTSGPDRGLVRNYQITGETAVRAVIRVEYERLSNNPNNPEYNVLDHRRPRIIVESFNSLAQD